MLGKFPIDIKHEFDIQVNQFDDTGRIPCLLGHHVFGAWMPSQPHTKFHVDLPLENPLVSMLKKVEWWSWFLETIGASSSRRGGLPT